MGRHIILSRRPWGCSSGTCRGGCGLSMPGHARFIPVQFIAFMNTRTIVNPTAQVRHAGAETEIQKWNKTVKMHVNK